jgi:hypothetical protein
MQADQSTIVIMSALQAAMDARGDQQSGATGGCEDVEPGDRERAPNKDEETRAQDENPWRLTQRRTMAPE